MLGILGVPGTAGDAEAADPPGPGSFSAQLGPEQRVFGPSHQVDMPFHTADRDGVRHGYLANGETVETTLGAGGQPVTARVVLRRGGKGTVDQCGSWLMGTVHTNPRNPRHWVAWYHAERSMHPQLWCQYSDGSTRWTMGLVESLDAGRTWHKPRYPANTVISQDRALLGDRFTEDAGNGRVVVMGDHFYMLFQASSREDRVRRLNIARAPLTSMGRPGSWKKYHCATTCGFTEPGLGGRSTHLEGIPVTARHLTWSSYLQRWITVAASGRYGFTLLQSEDLVTWTPRRMIYPHVSHFGDTSVDNWTRAIRHQRSAADKALYGYSSLLGADLDADRTGRIFWLYYMKVYPGEDFQRRYLVRRKVTLAPSASPVDRVQLTTYVDPRGNRTSSTEMPRPTKRYRAEAGAGHLLGGPRRGFVPLFECRRTDTDHFLRVRSCTPHAIERRVGWISPTRTTLAPVALHRCYDTVRRVHFASTNPTCAGKRREWVLGYVLNAFR